MDITKEYEQWQNLVHHVFKSLKPWIEAQDFPSLREADYDDILQSGRIGLLRAIQNSIKDPKPRNTLEMFVYARHAITNEMLKEVNRLASLVRIPRWHDIHSSGVQEGYTGALSCRVIADFLHLDPVKVHSEDGEHADTIFAQILFVDPSDCPDEIVAERDWIQHVIQTLRRSLDSRDWTVIHLISLGKKHKDIASELDISINQIRWTIRRVKSIAKELLENS